MLPSIVGGLIAVVGNLAAVWFGYALVKNRLVINCPENMTRQEVARLIQRAANEKTQAAHGVHPR